MAVRTALLPSIMLLTALAAGCLDIMQADEPDPSRDQGHDPDSAASTPLVEVTFMDEDQDGQRDWMLFTLADAPAPSYERSLVYLEVLYEGAIYPAFLCTTPEVSQTNGVCIDGFDVEDTWALGDSLYGQCVFSFRFEVSIFVAGEPALTRHPVDCGLDSGAPPPPADDGRESASATARAFDANDDGDVEWIRVTLVRGEHSPYSVSRDVVITFIDPNGGTDVEPCRSIGAGATCASPLAAEDEWAVGETLFLPCRGRGNHAVGIEVLGTTILDSTVMCDEAP